MWERNDYDDGFDTYKIGSGAPSPGWVPGCESTWQGAASSTTSSSSNRGRRHSTASDSGDTGIGTSCSDSVEDHSGSSSTLSFQPLRSQGPIPTAHVMPSPSSAKLTAPPAAGSWGSCQLPSPATDSPLDMKDPRPVRRWSSLTRLSGPAGDKGGSPGGRPAYRGDPHGSLDRRLLYGYRADGGLGLHARSPGAEPRYRYELCGKAEPPGPSPLKPATLDLTYSALPESKAPAPPGLQAPAQRGLPLGHQAVGVAHPARRQDPDVAQRADALQPRGVPRRARAVRPQRLATGAAAREAAAGGGAGTGTVFESSVAPPAGVWHYPQFPGPPG
ncbi:hypothetical protein AAFF_G00021020 [Aldrovandia affinis]|uniref:Uncharacterized protein n=1 Tax=Aldrovandia affinis TaxID=143900 RepID=A0AAD7S5B0_9TELE|nr:hypothetical protein AAFF_G00021020 [Aldrovandia affinis]